MKKVKLLFICLCVLCISSLCGCKKNEAMKENKPETPKEYLVVTDKTELTNHKIEYDIKATDTREAISELLDALNTYIDDIYTSPMSEKTNVISFMYEDGSVNIYFDGRYNEQLITEEVLVRSAIVDTLCQLEGVSDVSFYVEEAPLTIQGIVIGRMDSNTFLYDMAGTSESTFVTLYFPNEDYTKLVEVTREIKVDTMFTDEQLVVEELLKGPADSTGLKSAIPSGTKLLNVVTKDMVCYVNLSSEFINYIENVPDEMTIYSLVNSLAEVSGVRSVVISVEGTKMEMYRWLPCSEVLTVNYDLVEVIE